mgnify:CR=1 FL=1
MRLAINDSIKLDIQSRLFWNETEIEILSGEEYKFVAEGQWRDLTIKTDPDGYTKLYMRLFNRLKRSESNNWFALMGSLDKSGDFLIGRNNKIEFQKSGTLYCYANDVRGFYWNNSGHASLEVIRLS